MRTLAAILALMLALSACKKAEAPPPAEDRSRERPVDPNAPLELAKPDQARVQLDLAAVRAAIRQYQMLNSAKNPPDLSALQLQLSYPQDLAYDANSGMVKSRTYPMF